jgi:hypothetical protein
VAPVAGGAIAVMMVSAIAAHLRVNDPLMKSLPAFLMLLLSTVVVVAYTV